MMNYQDAGVSIEAFDNSLPDIQNLAQKTHSSGVMEGVGGFASLFRLHTDGRYEDPVLVSGTDGVGTKLLVAIAADQLETLGQDLVGMCANDIATTGAKPLFFLDYFATGQLAPQTLIRVIKGISQACQQIDCALVGGETAEMPGLYQAKHFDLAGFCVGVVERKNIVDGRQAKPGDVIVGLFSSGLHSNGFSLARKIIFEKMNKSIDDILYGNTKVSEALLIPTQLYGPTVQTLIKNQIPIRAMAHITGGGIPGNINRTLPKGLCAHVDYESWQRPEIFDVLKNNGPVLEIDMRETFNLGIGYTVTIPHSEIDATMRLLSNLSQPATVIGHVIEAPV